MGISGLLKSLQGISKPSHLEHYGGQRVGVDVSCWLHRSAYSCSTELCTGEPTLKWLRLCLRFVRTLQYYKIKPLMVFDGANLISKEGELQKRSHSRRENRQRGEVLLNEGKLEEAQEYFQRAIHISMDMVRTLMAALDVLKVEYMVSPYEADAQLAFLFHSSLVVGYLTLYMRRLPV